MNRTKPQEALSGTFSPVRRQVLPAQAHRIGQRETFGLGKQPAAMRFAAATLRPTAHRHDACSDGPVHTPLLKASASNILMRLPALARPHCFQGIKA
ncbi:hypothetical protein [Stutzerimonas zhaodongensis]|uniref:hypothetical protein n=1 Tax=Stutzerimonas TaxID=2901164 RepID=UPI00388E6ACB